MTHEFFGIYFENDSCVWNSTIHYDTKFFLFVYMKLFSCTYGSFITKLHSVDVIEEKREFALIRKPSVGADFLGTFYGKFAKYITNLACFSNLSPKGGLR